MSRPYSSPWGPVQHCRTVCPGVHEVDTARHGGIMVEADAADSLLSPAARLHGDRHGGFLCYEEDADAHIVIRELLDKKLWDRVPPRFESEAAFLRMIDESLAYWNPEYFRAREKPSVRGQLRDAAQEIMPRPSPASVERAETPRDDGAR